jgi:hypothetical protein
MFRVMPLNTMEWKGKTLHQQACPSSPRDGTAHAACPVPFRVRLQPGRAATSLRAAKVTAARWWTPMGRT